MPWRFGLFVVFVFLVVQEHVVIPALRLEVELRADLEEATIHDALRCSPHGERRVLLNDRVGIQRVVDVEIHR